jgi:hypothetical protein
VSNLQEELLDVISVILDMVIVVPEDQIYVLTYQTIPELCDALKASEGPISETDEDVILSHCIVDAIDYCRVHLIKVFEISSLRFGYRPVRHPPASDSSTDVLVVVVGVAEDPDLFPIFYLDSHTYLILLRSAFSFLIFLQFQIRDQRFFSN